MSSWGLFQPLRDRLVALLDLKVRGSPDVNPPPPEILHELTIHPSTAFAEDLSEEAIEGALHRCPDVSGGTRAEGCGVELRGWDGGGGRSGRRIEGGSKSESPHEPHRSLSVGGCSCA